ncbi:MAG: aldo/keto reductase [Micrococcus sp.]|nr:aldo/keto reductase [Micrococcus sp.]
MSDSSLTAGSAAATPVILGTMGWGAALRSACADGHGPDDGATALVRELAVTEAALDAGVRVLDTADIYGDGASERALGAVLDRLPQDRREQLRIQTKCGILVGGSPLHGEPGSRYDSSPAHVHASLQGSLERLGVASVDTLIIHRPDVLTPVADTVRTFLDAREAGLVRRLGVSNLSLERARRVHQTLQSLSADGTGLESVQIELSLTHRLLVEAEILAHSAPAAAAPQGSAGMVAGAAGLGEWCAQEGIELQAWSPLAQGRAVEVPGVSALAAREELAPEAVALAWLTRLPWGVRPVIGSLNPERVRACVQEREARHALTGQDWYALFTAARGETVP